MPDTIVNLKEALPEFAQDARLNVQNVLSAQGSPGLTGNQAAGVALASAYASGNATVARLVREHAAGILSPEEIKAAKTAAVTMAMNNVYYRFLHLVEDEEYRHLPARLRMTAIANPGVPKADFELYSISVSALNGCGLCVQSHARELAKAGLSKEGVQSAVRIAAVIRSAAQAVFIHEQGELS
jgi:lipoyl-dependent peroxiredoxin subunit D